MRIHNGRMRGGKMDNIKLLELKRLANSVRFGIIEGVYNAACGHPGGSRLLRAP